MSTKKIHFEISERKVLLRFFDIVAVFSGLYVIGFLVDFTYFSFSHSNISGFIVLACYLLTIGAIFEMYNLQVASNQFQIIKSIVLTTCFSVLFYLLTPVFTPFLPSNRIQILIFFLTILISLLLWRIFYQKYLASYRFEKRVVLICDSEQLSDLVFDLSKIDPHYKIIGVVCTTENNVLAENQNIDLIQGQNLNNFVIKNAVSDIVIASQHTKLLTLNLYNQLLHLLESGFPIREYTQVYETLTQRIPISHFGLDFYKFFPFSRSNNNKLYLLVARIIEILLAIIGLIGGCILLPVVLIGNLVANQGSLFYIQERVGKNGLLFNIYKLRTMQKNAEKNGAVFATTNDSRITTFGKFLRKTRIDEIPQFYNILVGDMAFIGPRPERPFFVKKLSLDLPFYDTRHIIKPGLTGWAQVNYAYGENTADSLIKLQYDLYYIKHRSVFLDINIIIKTISTVLFYRGQ